MDYKALRAVIFISGIVYHTALHSEHVGDESASPTRGFLNLELNQNLYGAVMNM